MQMDILILKTYVTVLGAMCYHFGIMLVIVMTN